jgi:hypothetical protein
MRTVYTPRHPRIPGQSVLPHLYEVLHGPHDETQTRLAPFKTLTKSPIHAVRQTASPISAHVSQASDHLISTSSANLLSIHTPKTSSEFQPLLFMLPSKKDLLERRLILKAAALKLHQIHPRADRNPSL